MEVGLHGHSAADDILPPTPPLSPSSRGVLPPPVDTSEAEPRHSDLRTTTDAHAHAHTHAHTGVALPGAAMSISEAKASSECMSSGGDGGPYYHLKVYADPRSASCRRVLLALAEKNLSYELVKIDLSAGGHKDRRFRLLNPFLRVPVLQDLTAGVKVYEPMAICRYLQTLASDSPSLIPTDGPSFASMEQFIGIFHSCFCPAMAKAEEELVTKAWSGKEPDLDVLEEARKGLEPVLSVMEARFEGGNEFLAGKEFSLADVAYMPEFDVLTAEAHADHFKKILRKRPATMNWWRKVSARVSWAHHVLNIRVDPGAKPFDMRTHLHLASLSPTSLSGMGSLSMRSLSINDHEGDTHAGNQQDAHGDSHGSNQSYAWSTAGGAVGGGGIGSNDTRPALTTNQERDAFVVEVPIEPPHTIV